MAHADDICCPSCGHRFVHISKPTWRDDLPQFLAFFCNMMTASETGRLIRAGLYLGMWGNRMTAHRRLNEMKEEGYINQPCAGWWRLTDSGMEIGAAYLAAHPDQPYVAGVNDPTSIPGPTIPGRPDKLDNVRTPTDWQILFLQEYGKLPEQSLIGFNAVVRWARKEGLFTLARKGKTAIRVLIGNGWLRWDRPGGDYLLLTDPAKRLLGYLPAVDRAPGVDDQTPA